MENSLKNRSRVRKNRVFRIRKSLRGLADRPRLCVFKTAKHLYVQLIDDQQQMTIASTSTLSKEFRQSEFGRKNVVSAKQLGLKIAEIAKGKNVNKVVFDRGRFKYHGVIASLAEGAREGGLQF